MGYEIKLKVDKLDSKYKPMTREAITDKDIAERKRIFIAWCMNQKLEDTKMWSLESLHKDFDFAFRFFLNYLEENWKHSIMKDLANEDTWCAKDEIIFCGWAYSERGNSDNKETIIDLYKDMLWYRISTIPYVSYFDNEDNWYKKKQDISEILDEFEESFWESCNKEFVDEYRDNEVKYDEEDEDDMEGSCYEPDKEYNPLTTEDLIRPELSEEINLTEG